MKDLEIHRENARNYHNSANCLYSNHEYIYHVDMVVNNLIEYKNIFINKDDYISTYIAGYYHDCIEDAQLSFNDIKYVSNVVVAKIVLAVTDVHEENRLLRHLMTMGKTVKDYRAIILKLCDIKANAKYSRDNKSSMYKKYVEEYAYRKPIFKKALTWYSNELNMDIVNRLWIELDNIHGYFHSDIPTDI